MSKTLRTFLGGIALSLAVTGCSMLHKSSSSGSGGGAPAKSDAPFAGTMAEAPLYHAGASIKGPAGCNESGYAKFDFPAGQPLKMDVAVEGPAGSCLSVTYMKANGGAVEGMMKELCIDKNGSESWDIEGQEGGSFVQVLEEPPCKGAGITIATH